MHNEVSTDELDKVINKVEATLVYSEINSLNRAMSLAFFELLGNASLINEEAGKYRNVTASEIKTVAQELFRKTNCSTLYYKSKN